MQSVQLEMYFVFHLVPINRTMVWVALLLAFLSNTVVFSELHEGRNESMANVDFERSVSESSGGKMLYNVSANEVIPTLTSTLLSSSSSSPVAVRPIEMGKESINNNVKEKVTVSSPDNDYQSMRRAFDTFNEKMEIYMNFYGNEMSFLTTKLNTLKDKLNTLEILHHEIDQVLNHQNTAEQKLQLIQDAMFGSQSIIGKLDRLESSMQQLDGRIDELQEKQSRLKLTPQTVQTKQTKESDDPLSDSDEQFRNVESKIEQLVAFVHSFAELNRLESTDILTRLGNMQSQLIQFFDVKGTIANNQFSQRNENGTTEHGYEIVEETTQNLNHLNDTNALKDGANGTNEIAVIIGNASTEMVSTISNSNDDRNLTTPNIKSIRKRKRMTNMQNRAKRNQGVNTLATFRTFHSENSNRIERMMHRDGNRHDGRHITIPNFDNPKIDIEIDYSATKSDKQVNAKYGQATHIGCHEFSNLNRADEIHRYTTKSGASERLCCFDSGGPAWTVIQFRGLLNNVSTPENFNRSWHDYKIGFGNLSGEFWYGNDLIHKLTYDDDMELKIKLDTWDGRSIEFEYEIFRVDSEENRYNLFVGGFKGRNKDLDALAYHHNQDFSTFDRQNDKSGIDDNRNCCSCAKSYASGWWFNNCIEANLNGIYQFNPLNNNYVGIIWEKWLGDYSLKSTKMMIRPKIEWPSRGAGHELDDDSSKKPPDDP